MSGPGGPVVRVAIVGLGAIGREVFKAVKARAGLELVAVADPAPALVGQDAGELSGVGACGVRVVASAAEAFARPDGVDVALVLTGSGVADVLPVVEAAAARGVDVISTCEDLSYADLSAPALARQLDARARAGGITVLGTGVNPGFVMDRLPLTLAAACVRVDSVRVERVVDAAKRRGPLRAKVGADLTPAEFEAGVAARRLGHRGLPESCALVGLGLGFKFDEVKNTIEAVVTSAANPRAGIQPGRVAGLRQSAVGLRGGVELVRLDLEMSVAAPDPHDRVVIAGDPPLDVLVQGGTHGDRGTVGATLSAIPAVVAASPGLKTVLDIPLIG
ncbi:MAG TPA: Gfo/Idh/MocA family oxidoreductase [Polyangia bacterium]|nr:Gfo/Idh/MocA family oxidoreductase [Polyangia bacterium]